MTMSMTMIVFLNTTPDLQNQG